MIGRTAFVVRQAWWLPLFVWAACSGVDPASPQRGAMLFQSRELSSSSADIFTCASCHDTTGNGGAMATIKTGAALAGVTARPSFWGGMEADVLDAINDCRLSFMSDRMALARDDADAESLYAYLAGLRPADAAPVPFTVISNIVNVARGDAGVGGPLFTRACGACHGDMHTGAGRLAVTIPVLPEDALTSHATYDVLAQRLIFIEKVRHGGFFGYTGVMPPFSEEVLPDEALGDVLEAMAVTGVAADTGDSP